jgi:hypothetical protein
LGVKYFSSSNIVHQLIEQYGIEQFSFEIRKVFVSKSEAVNWEWTVLRRLNAAQSPLWLNKHNGEGRTGNGFTGMTHTEGTKQKIAAAQRGRKRPDLTAINRGRTGISRGPMKESTKQKIAAANLGKKHPELAARNRLRKKDYHS